MDLQLPTRYSIGIASIRQEMSHTGERNIVKEAVQAVTDTLKRLGLNAQAVYAGRNAIGYHSFNHEPFS